MFSNLSVNVINIYKCFYSILGSSNVPVNHLSRSNDRSQNGGHFKFSVASWAIEKVLSPIFQGDRRPGQILVVLGYFYPCIGMTDDDTILLSDTELENHGLFSGIDIVPY
jgi:hypothetical protein